MTDLSDAALRDLAVKECVYAAYKGMAEHTSCVRCEWQAKGYIALRDAARAEQREQIEALEDAITEIADFIPTDQTINIPALVNRAIAASMDRKRA